MGIVFKFLKWVVAPIVILLLLLVAYFAYTLWKHEMFEEPTFETVASDIPDAGDKPHVLVFSKTNGFRHIDAIPAAHMQCSTTWPSPRAGLCSRPKMQRCSMHKDLAKFDLIVWNNVSGDVFLPEQRKAFKDTYGKWRAVPRHSCGWRRSQL